MDETTISTPTYHIFRDKHGIPQFSPKRGTQALKDALIYAFPTLETELQLMQAALKKFFDSERGIQIICELPENDLQMSLAKKGKRDVEVSPIVEQKEGLRNWKVGGSGRPGSRMGTSRGTSRAPSRTGSRAGSRASSRASSCTRDSEVGFVGGGVGGLMTTWSLESGRELERRKKAPYDPVKRRKVAENRGNACEKHRAAKSACDPMACPQNKMFGKVADESQSGDQAVRAGGSQERLIDSRSSVLNATAALGKAAATTSTNMSKAPDRDFVTVPVEADVFWDASDQADVQDASLNFGHMSTSSYTGSWTDSSYTDLLSWSPNSSCLTAADSTQASLAMAPEMPHQKLPAGTRISASDMTNDHQAHIYNISTPIPYNCPLQHYPSLSYPSPSDEASAPNLTPASTAQREQTLTCSEDPFMGWASKKANQMFDDYGWVLSHVETL